MDVLESTNGPAPVDSPAVFLRLAEAVAGRCETAEPGRRSALQQQVVRLCDRATRLAVRQPADYPAVLRRCASAMLEVGAFENAEKAARLLVALPEVRADVQGRSLAMRLVSRALRALGRPAEALQQLEGLPAGGPDLEIERGCCLLAVRQWEQALAAFRQVRRTTSDGTPQWCEATLRLAEALQSTGRLTAAEEILRVAQVLYPEFGNARLLAELNGMRKAMGGVTKPAAESP
jgi:tetratricopeptide (TPR) repeat protein